MKPAERERLRTALNLVERCGRIEAGFRRGRPWSVTQRSADMTRAAIRIGTFDGAAREFGRSSNIVRGHIRKVLAVAARLNRGGVEPPTLQGQERADYLERMLTFNKHLRERERAKGIEHYESD